MSIFQRHAVPLDAVKARAEVERQHQQASALNQEIRGIIPKLQEIRERNHFAERLTDLFTGEAKP